MLSPPWTGSQPVGPDPSLNQERSSTRRSHTLQGTRHPLYLREKIQGLGSRGLRRAGQNGDSDTTRPTPRPFQLLATLLPNPGGRREPHRASPPGLPGQTV